LVFSSEGKERGRRGKVLQPFLSTRVMMGRDPINSCDQKKGEELKLSPTTSNPRRGEERGKRKLPHPPQAEKNPPPPPPPPEKESLLFGGKRKRTRILQLELPIQKGEESRGVNFAEIKM